MVTTAERQQLREELVSQGYAWDYIDSWQPKTVLYRHAPGLDVNGKVSSPVGTPIKGVPGNPDYVARKSRLGMLPYPPTENCECRWCLGRRGSTPEVAVAESPTSVEEIVIKCDQCEFEAKGVTTPGAMSRLRVHSKTH
jgi:hypothetical protein